MMCETPGGHGTDMVFLTRSGRQLPRIAVRTVREHRKGWASLGVAIGVGVAEFGKDKWPADGAVRALLEYLDELHREAGRPSYTEMGRSVILAASTLSPFFTGTRLIGKGNLQLLVELLDGDTAKAERLRKKAAVEWSTRPQPAAPPEPGASRGRRRYFFKAGCGLGQNLTLLPSTDAQEFVEFLDTLRLIGLGPGEIEPFREIRRTLPFAESDEAGRALLYGYAAALDDAINLVRERSSAEEFRWFTLGRLLHSIAFMARMTWPDDPGEDIEGARTGLFHLSDLLDVPEGFRAELKSYSTMALPTVGRAEVLAEAERLRQACYAIL
jgi:hypothetical protein